MMSASLLVLIDQRLNSIINRDVQLGVTFDELRNMYPRDITLTYYLRDQIRYANIYYKPDFSECVIATGNNDGSEYRMTRCVSGNIQAFIDAFKNKDRDSGSDVSYDSDTLTYTYKGHSIGFK